MNEPNESSKGDGLTPPNCPKCGYAHWETLDCQRMSPEPNEFKTCPKCEGKGYFQAFTGQEPCLDCKETGKVPNTRAPLEQAEGTYKTTGVLCDNCGNGLSKHKDGIYCPAKAQGDKCVHCGHVGLICPTHNRMGRVPVWAAEDTEAQGGADVERMVEQILVAFGSDIATGQTTIFKTIRDILTPLVAKNTQLRGAGDSLSSIVESIGQERDQLRAELAKVREENELLYESLPMLCGRTNNEARKLIGEAKRHDDGNGASHGCVEVMAITNVVELLIAEKNQLISELKKAKRLNSLHCEYEKLLSDELDELVPLCSAHGWESTRYEEGVRLRAAMEELK